VATTGNKYLYSDIFTSNELTSSNQHGGNGNVFTDFVKTTIIIGATAVAAACILSGACIILLVIFLIKFLIEFLLLTIKLTIKK